MIAVDIPEEAESLLQEMAKATGRSASDIVRSAVLDCLEDWEDAAIAEQRLAEDDGVRISLEQVMLDLERREAAEGAAKSAAE